MHCLHGHRASNVLGLTATLNPARTEFTISGTPAMNVTQTTVYNYQIETTGSDCSPEIVLNGSLTLEPQDSISLIITPTLRLLVQQVDCMFMDLDNPANAIAEPIQPIEYQLDGGAIGNPVSIRYRANGGAYIPGLPAGLGSTVTASNTVLITVALLLLRPMLHQQWSMNMKFKQLEVVLLIRLMDL